MAPAANIRSRPPFVSQVTTDDPSVRVRARLSQMTAALSAPRLRSQVLSEGQLHAAVVSVCEMFVFAKRQLHAGAVVPRAHHELLVARTSGCAFHRALLVFFLSFLRIASPFPYNSGSTRRLERRTPTWDSGGAARSRSRHPAARSCNL